MMNYGHPRNSAKVLTIFFLIYCLLLQSSECFAFNVKRIFGKRPHILEFLQQRSIGIQWPISLFLPFFFIDPVLADSATFSGGDMYILQSVFNDAKYDPSIQGGIEKVLVGYVHQKDQETEEVIQSVQVKYDPIKVKYKVLLGKYWRNVKPTQVNGQFDDKGPQFRSIVWVQDNDERDAAVKSKSLIEASGIYGAERDKITFEPVPPGPPLVTEVKDIGKTDSSPAYFTPLPDEEQITDAQQLKSKRDRSGRTKYFQDTYGVKTYSDPLTKVGGFVTFPCSGSCIQAIDGAY